MLNAQSARREASRNVSTYSMAPKPEVDSLSADARAQSLPVNMQKLRAMMGAAPPGSMRLGTPSDEATFIAMREKQGLRAPIKIAADTTANSTTSYPSETKK